MLATIASLLGLLVLVLAVPLDISLRLRGLEGFEGRITIRWLFGLMRFRIRLPDPARSKSPQRRGQPRPGEGRAKRLRGGGGDRALAAFRERAFRQRAYRLARDLLRATHPRQLALRMRLGLGDPADTGRLWAFVGPLNAAAQDLRNAEVSIEPDFTDAVLEFDAHGRFVLFPIQFLALVASFALSPPSMRAWSAAGGADA